MKLMNKILIIDPGKGWGQFVSKMYCYQKLANHLNSKIIFFTKKSTQAEHYLKSLSFCEDVLYIDEPKKGIKYIFSNIKSIIKNIKKINQFQIEQCYVFHPSLRYLLIAYLSNIKEIWGLGFKFQNFFLKKNKRFYSSFFSKTKSDDEALEAVKKITNSQKIDFQPLPSIENNLRELGFGDVAVNKKMKDLNKIFYDILLKLSDKTKNFNINQNLSIKYFEKLKNSDEKRDNFNKYFTKFYNYCFELSVNNMIKEIQKFKF